MLSGALSLGIQGIEAQIVEIEVDIISGLPNFTIVGLPDSTIKEARERIRSAVENSGLAFPPKHYIVNLAPAGFRKQGSNFDLPIAIAILHATNQCEVPPDAKPMVGELSLDGRVRPVKGVICMAISLYRKGYRSIIVPWENRLEASAITGIDVYPVKTIDEALEALYGRVAPFKGGGCELRERVQLPDFSDVKGQEAARRAIEIATAGHHNIMLYGPPGSGKTMLAKRICSIMPELTMEQAIETTMIHSVGSRLDSRTGLLVEPPFRAPHHTSSDVALVGGGQVPSVGEVSLAHNGILFLDEFVEFKNNVIQALRQPLEDNEITVSRAMGSCCFPADFMLVAASNPCQCGYLFDADVPCICPPHRVRGYFQKIAGPVLDRIDIEIPVHRVPYRELLSENSSEDSASIRERVMAARELQIHRFYGKKTKFNARMTHDEIREFCKITPDSETLLLSAIKKLNFTARSFFKILKVSRTIADLAGEHTIKKNHVLEALSYKNLQRNYNV